jgi:hypothetical protein
MLKSDSIILYLLLLAFLFLAGCEGEISTPVEPDRPPNIPTASIWVGGLDGGVFVLVKKLEKSNSDLYEAEIHYISGELAYRGPMKIFPAGASFDPAKKESFEGWDGDNLYLSKNRYLKVQE